MNRDMIRAAAATVRTESAALKPVHTALAARLHRLAQMMLDGAVSGDGAIDGSLQSPLAEASMYNFDPAQEVSHHGVAEMSKKESPLHPGISSFVKEPEHGDMGMEDNRKTHVAQVTFKAPPDINEGDIMNFIIGIKDALDVEVEGFQWNVRPPKSQQSK